MADWTDITPYRVGKLTDEDDLNAVRDNLNFLANPPLVIATLAEDITLLAVQEMVPVDPDSLIEITTQGGNLVCLFTGVVTSAGVITQSLAMGISIDGQLDYKNGAFGVAADVWAGYSGAANGHGFTILMPVFNISAGVHTISPVWAVSSATTVTLLGSDYPAQFAVWEI